MNFRPLIALVGVVLLCQCSVRNLRLQMGPPNVDSYKSFPSKTFEPAAQPFRFFTVNDTRTLGKNMRVNKGPLDASLTPLETYLQHSATISFSIIRNDTILYEYFDEDYNANSVITSFSVAKSYVNAIMGVALKEGKVKSIEEPITNYFPELTDPFYKTVNIRHLMNHVSGIEFPSITHFYYTRDLTRFLRKMKPEFPPGTEFKYDNGNTQLIAYLIERATGERIQDYFETRIWNKLQPESKLLWSVDNPKDQHLKTFCCMNGLYRDLAKLGRLYLNKGMWNGEEIVPQWWVERSTRQDTTDASPWENELFWWIGPKEYGYFYAVGLYGQYIMVFPKKNIIITRFAKRTIHFNVAWKETMLQVVDQL